MAIHLSSLELREFVGNLAVVTTVLQFLSGIIVCKEYVINATTGEASPLPFLSGILSSILWLLYGLTKHDSKIIVVNIIGTGLMILYTTCFCLFTFKRASVLKQCFVVFSLSLLVIGYVSTVEDSELVLNRLGMLASIVTLLTVAAPMIKLLHVFKVKNTECLPFPMILMSFFVSVLWFVYGELEEDMNIANVNFIGGAIAAAQLCLFVIYPKKHQTPVSLLNKNLIA